MKRLLRHRRHPSGAIALLTIVTISAFTLAIVTAVSVIATSLISSATTHRVTEQVFYAAESGLHDGLFRLGMNPGAQTYNLPTMNGISTAVTIAIDPVDPHGKDRIITSVSNGQSIQRSLQVKARTGALGNSFAYAVQAGDGGIDMANGSEIWGDLLANGPITGSGTILGDVSSSGAAGSVTGVTIGKVNAPTPSLNCPNISATDPDYNNHELKSHSLFDLQVFGKAYYQVLPDPPGPPRFVQAGSAGNVTCNISGDGANCFGGQANPAPTEYPITPQQIADLQDLADNNTLPPGDVEISSDTTLTSRKIVGNLTVTGGTVTLDGPIWVTGVIDINHPGVTIRLPASIGESSGALITDQTMDIKNNAILQGSGNSKSFLIIIALKNDTSNFVIRGANNSKAVIYFAPDGLITVKENAGLNNTTGKKIQLENGSCIQYDPNLAGFFIPSGSPQPPLAQPTSWREL